MISHEKRLKMHPFRFIIQFIVLALFVGSVFAKDKPPADKKFIQVDVVINVLKGVPIKKKEIADIIKKANKVLKKSGVKLVVKKTVRNVLDEGNNDGNLGGEDFEDQFKRGEKELEDTVGKSKGYKLIFANDLFAPPPFALPVEGATPHGRPVSLLDVQPIPGNAAERKKKIDILGRRLAHEFCHAFTLGPFHKTKKTAADTDGKADKTAHVADETNLMHREAKGENLSKEQIDEIKKKLAARAKVKKKEKKSEKPKEEKKKVGEKHDGKSGESGETPNAPPHKDIRKAQFYFSPDEQSARVSIQFHGLLPHSKSAGMLHLYFDLDDNVATGTKINTESDGIGAEILLKIEYTKAEGKQVHVTGLLRDLVSDREWNLETLKWVTEPLLLEANSEDPSIVASPMYEAVEVQIPATLFANTANKFRMLAQSWNGEPQLFDDLVMDIVEEPVSSTMIDLDHYDASIKSKITITGRANVGGSVKLYLDDMLLAEVERDASGAFAHTFNAPDAAGYYWIYVVDADGNDDFTILDVTDKTYWLLRYIVLLIFIVFGLMALVLRIHNKRTKGAKGLKNE